MRWYSPKNQCGNVINGKFHINFFFPHCFFFSIGLERGKRRKRKRKSGEKDQRPKMGVQ